MILLLGVSMDERYNDNPYNLICRKGVGLMASSSLIYPAFALVLLTMGVAIRMAQLRFRSVLKGDLNPRYFEYNRDGTVPAYLAKVEQNYANLLEIPILFYAAVALFLTRTHVDLIDLIVVWCFVASRYIHTFIHISYNHVMHRFYAFLTGVVLVMIIWIRLVMTL